MQQLVIVSGRSGSGKSTALGVLEDNDYYCIDNLPATLLPDLVERTLINNQQLYQRIAVSIDARNLPQQLERFPQLLNQLKSCDIQCLVLFLDADDEVLLKRFSETRRRHPLTSNVRSLPEAIAAEKELLGPIIDLADLRIDTTHLNLNQLRDLIQQRELDKTLPGTSFLIESFGFKRGAPVDADIIFDMRSLPNPYWVPELRGFSGLDQQVADYLQAQEAVKEMFQDVFAYLHKWLPRIAASNRAYVTIGIGCTGGQHRSVYMTERLGRELGKSLDNVQIRHRDVVIAT